MAYFIKNIEIITRIILFLLVSQFCIKFVIGQCDYENLNEISINEPFNYVEGDIKLKSQDYEELVDSFGNDPFAPKLAVPVNSNYLWEDGIIMYKFSQGIINNALIAYNIRKVFQLYESKTCLKFIPWDGIKQDYVEFIYGEGCYSYVGRQGGRQEVSIGEGCEITGIIIHEINHFVGRWHEQNRYDRDSHVRINQENIIPGFVSQFEKISSIFATTQNLPYDFGSIMHYGTYSFTDNRLPTISTLDPSKQSLIGQRVKLSDIDIKHINNLYCKGITETDSNWNEWGPFTYCRKNCNSYKQIRFRSCKSKDYTGCDGNFYHVKLCGESSCLRKPYWDDWKQWSVCSNKCGKGFRFRLRECLEGDICTGNRSMKEECTGNMCTKANWNSWNAWSDCSASCGGGVNVRTRQCEIDGKCTGSKKEFTQCNKQMCKKVSVKELKGLINEGCFYFTSGDNLITFRAGSSRPIHHHKHPHSHHHKHDHKYHKEAEKAIVKCAKKVYEKGYLIFAMIGENCIIEEIPYNNLTNYNQTESTSCEDGIGNYEERLSMDVWSIQDEGYFNKKGIAKGPGAKGPGPGGPRSPRDIDNDNSDDDDDEGVSTECRQQYLNTILGIATEPAKSGDAMQTGHSINLFVSLIAILLALLY